MSSDQRPILVTGAAGFIGSHVATRLVQLGKSVVGVDNLNPYYDPQLKQDRLTRLVPDEGFDFVELDIADAEGVADVFARYEFGAVVHLAAQAGVRYSVDHPDVYVASNLVGFSNVIEGCRRHKVGHFVYASSSSVYGANRRMPFCVHHGAAHPLSLYAASKRSNELVAHAYANLYGLPSTGLRFFTVYGPWGRPDMAIFKFTRAILEGQPIDVYNHGDMKRDFTYVDDVVEGVVRILEHPPQEDERWTPSRPDPATSGIAPYRLYNIGNGRPVDLMELIEVLEDALGVEAKKNLLPLQPGDVPITYADTSDLECVFGFSPRTSIRDGVQSFVSWYRAYYGV